MAQAVGLFKKAAEQGHLGAAYSLIAANADPNLKASNGMTAMMLANHYRYKEIVELLKKAGAK